MFVINSCHPWYDEPSTSVRVMDTRNKKVVIAKTVCLADHVTMADRTKMSDRMGTYAYSLICNFCTL